jgi:hypothetical protein
MRETATLRKTRNQFTVSMLIQHGGDMAHGSGSGSGQQGWQGVVIV